MGRREIGIGGWENFVENARIGAGKDASPEYLDVAEGTGTVNRKTSALSLAISSSRF